MRRRTKVWVGLQVSLHGVDEVPAGQEDEHGSDHLQRLDVLQQSLHQLEGRLLLINLSHRMLRLRRVLRTTDHITVSLHRRERTTVQLQTEIFSQPRGAADSDTITVPSGKRSLTSSSPPSSSFSFFLRSIGGGTKLVIWMQSSRKYSAKNKKCF